MIYLTLLDCGLSVADEVSSTTEVSPKPTPTKDQDGGDADEDKKVSQPLHA